MMLSLHRWPGPPRCTMWALKNILVETLNNVGHPTRCPQPLNSVRLMVSYIVQCLHNDFFKPTLCKGGVPATCVFDLLIATFPAESSKSDVLLKETARALFPGVSSAPAHCDRGTGSHYYHGSRSAHFSKIAVFAMCPLKIPKKRALQMLTSSILSKQSNETSRYARNPCTRARTVPFKRTFKFFLALRDENCFQYVKMGRSG